MLVSEEVSITLTKMAKSRNVCALALGFCIHVFACEEPFPASKREHAVNIIFKEFLKYFPSNPAEITPETLLEAQDVSRSVFDARIHMIHALGLCFAAPECKSAYFYTYIDTLFKTTLEIKCHSLIYCAVLQVLAVYLPHTNRNRMRIE